MSLQLHNPHAWDLTPAQAIQLQREMRHLVLVSPLDLSSVRYVGGVDASFPPQKSVARSAAVVLSYPELHLVERAVAEVPLQFPYVPGLLSFRETPALLAALEKLSRLPDVLLVDGHGLAHPRRFGIACHLGVLLDRPSVGCAKSILVGSHDLPAEEPGATIELVDQGEVVGAALRMRRAARPVYVSIGHRVDLPTALRLVLSCGSGYRLPEPARLAHQLTTAP